MMSFASDNDDNAESGRDTSVPLVKLLDVLSNHTNSQKYISPLMECFNVLTKKTGSLLSRLSGSTVTTTNMLRLLSNLKTRTVYSSARIAMLKRRRERLTHITDVLHNLIKVQDERDIVLEAERNSEYVQAVLHLRKLCDMTNFKKRDTERRSHGATQLKNKELVDGENDNNVTKEETMSLDELKGVKVLGDLKGWARKSYKRIKEDIEEQISRYLSMGVCVQESIYEGKVIFKSQEYIKAMNALLGCYIVGVECEEFKDLSETPLKILDKFICKWLDNLREQYNNEIGVNTSSDPKNQKNGKDFTNLYGIISTYLDRLVNFIMTINCVFLIHINNDKLPAYEEIYGQFIEDEKEKLFNTRRENETVSGKKEEDKSSLEKVLGYSIKFRKEYESASKTLDNTINIVNVINNMVSRIGDVLISFTQPVASISQSDTLLEVRLFMQTVHSVTSLIAIVENLTNDWNDKLLLRLYQDSIITGEEGGETKSEIVGNEGKEKDENNKNIAKEMDEFISELLDEPNFSELSNSKENMPIRRKNLTPSVGSSRISKSGLQTPRRLLKITLFIKHSHVTTLFNDFFRNTVSQGGMIEVPKAPSLSTAIGGSSTREQKTLNSSPSNGILKGIAMISSSTGIRGKRSEIMNVSDVLNIEQGLEKMVIEEFYPNEVTFATSNLKLKKPIFQPSDINCQNESYFKDREADVEQALQEHESLLIKVLKEGGLETVFHVEFKSQSSKFMNLKSDDSESTNSNAKNTAYNNNPESTGAYYTMMSLPFTETHYEKSVPTSTMSVSLARTICNIVSAYELMSYNCYEDISSEESPKYVEKSLKMRSAMSSKASSRRESRAPSPSSSKTNTEHSELSSPRRSVRSSTRLYPDSKASTDTESGPSLKNLVENGLSLMSNSQKKYMNMGRLQDAATYDIFGTTIKTLIEIIETSINFIFSELGLEKGHIAVANDLFTKLVRPEEIENIEAIDYKNLTDRMSSVPFNFDNIRMQAEPLLTLQKDKLVLSSSNPLVQISGIDCNYNDFGVIETKLVESLSKKTVAIYSHLDILIAVLTSAIPRLSKVIVTNRKMFIQSSNGEIAKIYNALLDKNSCIVGDVLMKTQMFVSSFKDVYERHISFSLFDYDPLVKRIGLTKWEKENVQAISINAICSSHSAGSMNAGGTHSSETSTSSIMAGFEKLGRTSQSSDIILKKTFDSLVFISNYKYNYYFNNLHYFFIRNTFNAFNIGYMLLKGIQTPSFNAIQEYLQLFENLFTVAVKLFPEAETLLVSKIKVEFDKVKNYMGVFYMEYRDIINYVNVHTELSQKECLALLEIGSFGKMSRKAKTDLHNYILLKKP